MRVVDREGTRRRRRRMELPLLWFPRTEYRAPSKDLNEGMRSGPYAPLSWPIEACFIAGQAAVEAQADTLEGWEQLKVAPVVVAVMLAEARLRPMLERRRARQLGVTPETAPEPRVDFAGTVGLLVVVIGRWGYLRAQGIKVDGSWERRVAQRIIREVERRRAWRAAWLKAQADAAAE